MNCYAIATGDEPIKCVQAEADELNTLLDAEQDEDHGFEFVYYSEYQHGFLQAPESASPENLPVAALSLIGNLCSSQGLPHVELGIAFTADRMMTGSHGGTAWRIYPDGTLKQRKETWE